MPSLFLLIAELHTSQVPGHPHN